MSMTRWQMHDVLMRSSESYRKSVETHVKKQEEAWKRFTEQETTETQQTTFSPIVHKGK